MLKVILYSRAECHLCEEAEEAIRNLQKIFTFDLSVLNIGNDSNLEEQLGLEIPVIEAGPFRLKAPFTQQELEMTIRAANDRHQQIERLGENAPTNSSVRDLTVSRSDRVAYWLSKHYLLLINLFLLIYFGVPFLAPVFKNVGLDLPAEVIYKIYSPVCHQWSFRSWFLFGVQPYYPHAEAGIENVITFEEATGISDITDPDRIQARLFEGNELLGYKVALCERDEAIWGSMFIFGMIYAISGRRIKKLHWIFWILFGLVPVALDGFSQLLSQIPVQFIKTLIPYRESTPLLRTITGFLFGWTTAWFTIPLMEETMGESWRELAKKYSFKKTM